MKKIGVLLSVMMFACFGTAAICCADEAVYFPSTGRVTVPQLILDGDSQGTVFSVDFQQRGGTWVFDLANVALAPVAPERFTQAWIAGKTLYRVWHGNGIRNGVTLESVPVVIKVYFSPNGIAVIDGIHNNDVVHGVASYTVGGINGRLFIADADDNLSFEIVCGSTSRYIKTHAFDFEGFNNVNLFYFDKGDAISAAEFLASDPPGCPTGP